MATQLIDPMVELEVKLPGESQSLNAVENGLCDFQSDAESIEVYPCPGVNETRLVVRVLRLCLIGLPLLLIALSLPGGEGAGLLWVGGGVVGLALVLSIYNKQAGFCELRIAPEWAEFVSLIETRRVRATEVIAIVRHVPESDPSRITQLEVCLRSGTEKPLTNHEQILDILRRFSPSAAVTTKTYDDTETSHF